MESDLGKLFVGGISWNTNEDRLGEYFKSFGEVVEAVIIKDRITGRARGFGFVVFADPAVAERVVLEKHLIDGRMVEAKKAVPRDEQHILNRNSGSIPGSPALGRSRKIFVGGLASTVTDSDFKKYFEQFGTITDVVVMFDHNTRRPRGFGFITFGSEDAIDKVLLKTFHELNGKMVEVKRAVPKELSPGPNMRLPMEGNGYGLNRVNNILSGHNPVMRMDGLFGQLSSGRKGLPPFSPSYGLGMNFESGTSLSSSFDYGRNISPYYNANSSRFGSPVTYSAGSGNPDLPFTSTARNLWNNGDLNYNTNHANSTSYMPSTSGFGNSSLNWVGSSSPLVGENPAFTTGNMRYGVGDNSFGLVAGGYGRNNNVGSINTSFTAQGNGYEGNYTDSYGGNNSIYGDPTWQSALTELDGSSPFAYGFGAIDSDVAAKSLPGYMGGYNVTTRQMNRGVVAA